APLEWPGLVCSSISTRSGAFRRPSRPGLTGPNQVPTIEPVPTSMSSETHATDFGGKLRAARERRGVTLRQIANATKISVGVLEALERNDISRLPGGIFGRAFVRYYAVEVGLDPEQTIQDFIAQLPHDSVTVGHPTSAQIEDNEAVESDRRTASTFLRL